MMKNLRGLLLSVALLGSTMASAQVLHPAHMPSATDLKSGEIYYTYDDGVSTSGTWGTGKKENYDVAIHVVEPALVGKKVEGMVLYLFNETGLSNLKCWLSKELTLDSDKKNVPDITSVSANIAKGWVEVRFSEPYTITSDGFYAGYSLNVDDLDNGNNKYPLYCTLNADAEGLYLHTSKTYRKWVAKGESTGVALCLKVILSGVDAASAGVSMKSAVNSEINKKATTSVTVVNHGSDAISSVDYSYTLDGSTYTGSKSFSTPIEARYGASSSFNISLPAMSKAEFYPVTFSIDKVNGVANADASAKANFDYKVYTMLPTHRPVMEEYTGTWCGYCPRGFVGMEYMSNHYKDFVGLAYHNGDDMEVMSSGKFPSSISGYPSAYLDRELDIDAFYGLEYGVKNFGVADDWSDRAAEVAKAKVEINGGLADDGNTVKVRTEVAFIDSYTDADFHVEYALLADSLHSDSWYQSNYYSGESGLPEEFDVFTEGGSKIYGLYYNDVIVASSRLSQAGSADYELPSEITAYETLYPTCEFKLDQVKNTSGKAIIQNNENLEVVAMVVDGSTGYIVNAAKVKVNTDPTGISSVKTDSNASAGYYDLSGRKVENASKGIFIKKTADGKVQKIMIK